MPYADRTDPAFISFQRTLALFVDSPPTAELAEVVMDALGNALSARPLERADAARRAIDDVWPRFVRRVEDDGSPLLAMHERYRERCDRHDRIVATHTCPTCRVAAHAIYVLRRPLRQDECRVCASCRDRELASGKVRLCDTSVRGDCTTCTSRLIELFCVGSATRPLTLRACGNCATPLKNEGWRPIVVSTR